jgi:hypothetical protein
MQSERGKCASILRRTSFINSSVFLKEHKEHSERERGNVTKIIVHGSRPTRRTGTTIVIHGDGPHRESRINTHT